MSMCVASLPLGLVHGLYSDLDVYNKIDAISLEQTDKLAREPNTVVISCEMDLKSAKVLMFCLQLIIFCAVSTTSLIAYGMIFAW